MAERSGEEIQRLVHDYIQKNAKYMPPSDWSDKEAWIRCHTACLEGRPASENERYKFPLKNRFRPFAEENRGRIWFPGCGLSETPLEYAEGGCDVLATDFSPPAVAYQKELREIFLQEREQAEVKGNFEVADHDFLLEPPATDFDQVINQRGFHGLTEANKLVAAKTFYAALKPGGACCMETLNVSSTEAREKMEDILIDAGFFIPFLEAERWLQRELEKNPRIKQCDRAEFEEIRKPFKPEYERRREEEAVELKRLQNAGATRFAYFVHQSG